MTDDQANDKNVSIGGNAVGVNIGGGSFSAQQIAGGDMTIHGSGGEKNENWLAFEKQAAELRRVIKTAAEQGEVKQEQADETIVVIDQAEEAVRKGMPEEAMDKLRVISEFIGDLMEDVDPKGVIGRAVPIVALMLQLAMRIISQR